MKKMITLLGPADGQTWEEFEKFYLGEHADRVLAIDSIKHFKQKVSNAAIQNLTDAAGSLGGDKSPDNYGYDEIWFTGAINPINELYKSMNIIGCCIIN